MSAETLSPRLLRGKGMNLVVKEPALTSDGQSIQDEAQGAIHPLIESARKIGALHQSQHQQARLGTYFPPSADVLFLLDEHTNLMAAEQDVEHPNDGIINRSLWTLQDSGIDVEAPPRNDF